MYNPVFIDIALGESLKERAIEVFDLGNNGDEIEMDPQTPGVTVSSTAAKRTPTKRQRTAETPQTCPSMPSKRPREMPTRLSRLSSTSGTPGATKVNHSRASSSQSSRPSRKFDDKVDALKSKLLALSNLLDQEAGVSNGESSEDSIFDPIENPLSETESEASDDIMPIGSSRSVRTVVLDSEEAEESDSDVEHQVSPLADTIPPVTPTKLPVSTNPESNKYTMDFWKEGNDRFALFL